MDIGIDTGSAGNKAVTEGEGIVKGTPRNGKRLVRATSAPLVAHLPSNAEEGSEEGEEEGEDGSGSMWGSWW